MDSYLWQTTAADTFSSLLGINFAKDQPCSTENTRLKPPIRPSLFHPKEGGAALDW
jgi:hypothetical protein